LVQSITSESYLTKFQGLHILLLKESNMLNHGANQKIQRFRYSFCSNPLDSDIAWAIPVYKSRDQLKWCLRNLRRHYPNSRVILISDGDGEKYDDIASEFKCHYIQGEFLMCLPTCHSFVDRLLRSLLAGDETYLFKIDPDTGVWRRLSALPAFSSLFGTLETISEGHGTEIDVPANVQGGCIGMTRDVVEEILSSGLLNEKLCRIDYRKTWARCSDIISMAEEGKCSDDFVISWACYSLHVPIVECPDIRCRWRRQIKNENLRYAITHPHKLKDHMATPP
jgi:hypothetical protein